MREVLFVATLNKTRLGRQEALISDTELKPLACPKELDLTARYSWKQTKESLVLTIIGVMIY